MPSIFPSIALSAIILTAPSYKYVEDCHASAPCKKLIPVKTSTKTTLLDF
jgi:hypothetical protein